MPCKPPKGRSKVYIEHNFDAGVLRDLDRLPARSGYPLGGKMSTCYDDTSRPSNQGWINIVLGESHICTIFAIKDVRKRGAVPDRKKNERGQSTIIQENTSRGNAFSLHFGDNESTHLFIAYPSQDSRL
jgi:hypothetical protein